MNRPLLYGLDGHTPRPAETLEWARWREANRERLHVGDDTLPDGTRVSTVFLGVDHRHNPGGPPLLFETMVFPGGRLAKERPGWRDFLARWETWAEAGAGHAAVLARVKRAVPRAGEE